MQSKFASHLVIGAMSAMTLCGASWADTPSYTVKEVHPEFAEVFPKAMNNRAKAGITFTNAKGKTADAVCGPKACATVPVLPTAPKGESAHINGINKLGHVVGWSATDRVYAHAIVFDGVATREIGAFDEDGCGGCSLISWAKAINDTGVIVGESQTANGSFQGFIWKDGVMSKLPTLGGNSSAANAINQRGIVAGSAETGSGAHHAAIFRKGKVQDLGVLGTGSYSTAYDINNSDVVVGESTMDGPNVVRPFIYRAGAIMQLPLPANAFNGAAGHLNDAGWVVGWFQQNGESRGRGWVYDGTASYDLNSLIPAADQAQWRIGGAADINAAGQILVFAYKPTDTSFKSHTLILTPVAPTN